MKLHTSINTIEKSNNFSESNYKIEATAKAFSILSDGLYSNKIKAVVRELSTNAYDSHVDAGHPERPFDVVLPTRLEPVFSIRDYGTGLSEEDCMSLYTTYFRSNKTDSNDAVGCLGLGSKSPFAYTDQFMVESYFNGEHMTFSSYKNENGEPVFALLNTQSTSEPNGLKVSMSVNSGDLWEFQEEAQNIYQNFNVRPTVNLDLEYSDREVLVEGDGWKIYNQGYDNNVIMGQVSYPIDNDQFDYESEAYKLLESCNGFELTVNIGDVDITPSRESLSYNVRTKENLVAMVKTAIVELAQNISDSVSEAETLWEARLKYSEMSSRLSRVSSATDALNESVEWNGKKLFDNSYNLVFKLWEDGSQAKNQGELVYFSKSRWRESVSRETTRSINMGYLKNTHFLFEDIKRGAIGRIRKFLKDDGQGTVYMIRGDQEYLDEVMEIMGCDREDIKNVSSLPAPDTNYNRVSTGAQTARGWIWQKINDEWTLVEGTISVKDGGYYITASRNVLTENGLGYQSEDRVGLWLQCLENAGYDTSMFDGKILQVTPSKKRTMKLGERDNWSPVVAELQDKFRSLAKDSIQELVAHENGLEHKISGKDSGIRVEEILLIADSTKTKNSFKEMASIIRSNTLEQDDKSRVYIIKRALVNLRIWDEFSTEVSEKRVDFEELYDIMMLDYPMLRVMAEQTWNIDLEEEQLKVVANYIDGIKE